MTNTIDLNADLGEDESKEGILRDFAMMDIISSCNIACGSHAGSEENMERMLIAAKEKAVAAGAHPSYPDRQNFGRISLDISDVDLKNSLQGQLKTIKAIASKVGIKLRHIKPHGALYNDAQDQANLADILIDIAASEQLPLVGMSQSVLQEKADALGLPYIIEAIIDRRYTTDSRLVARSEHGAVIEENSNRLDQGIALATGNPIISKNGNPIQVSAETLCLHSDSAGAVETARAMRQRLEQVGIQIEAVNRGYSA